MLARESLTGEHAELAALAAELMALAEDEAADVDAIVRLRWSMGRLLAAHLAKEDQLLYPALARNPDPHIAELAARFAREMGGLAKGFRVYLTEWSGDSIRADRPGFLNHTRVIVAALHQRIAREEGELYQLLLDDAARQTG